MNGPPTSLYRAIKAPARLTRLLAVLAATFALAGCTVDDWIAVYWPDDPDNQSKASEIFWCESRHQFDAVSPDGANHGVAQINLTHVEAFERVTGKRWSEAIYGPHNVMFARWLWEQQGFAPWTCAR